MIKKLKLNLINILSKESVFILLSPYLILSFIKVENFYWLIIPSSILILMMDLLLNRIKSKIFSYLFLNGILYFFYSLIFYIDTYQNIHNLSFTYFSIIFIIVTAVVFYILLFESKDLMFLNVIFIIFCFTQIFSFENEISKEKILKKYDLSISNTKNKTSNKNNSPIILLITDGLSSSQEIFDITQETTDLKFDEFLISKNYIVKPEFKTESRWTQYSLSSLFNFNFHKSDSIKSIEVLESSDMFKKEFRFLVNANALVDSLNKKSIKSYSLGLTPFIKGQKVDDVLYMWGKEKYNFKIEFLRDYKWFQIFFHKSILNFIDQRFFSGSSYLYDLVRKEALSNLKNIEFKKNSFYFFHYFAPHSPFSYFDEFPLLRSHENDQEYFEGHVKYRRFMIQKLIDVLKMEKFNNTRIIITGDHGLRSEMTNPYMTLGGFKGFDEEVINSVESVQDIGSLILNSFKND